MVENNEKEIQIKIPQAEEFFDNMTRVKEDITLEFFGRIVTIVIAGLGLITALAWDEALKDIFLEFFGNLSTLNQKLGYAIFVTILSVVISIVIGRIFLKKNRKNKNHHK